jgi:hypothetical protein
MTRPKRFHVEIVKNAEPTSHVARRRDAGSTGERGGYTDLAGGHFTCSYADVNRPDPSAAEAICRSIRPKSADQATRRTSRVSKRQPPEDLLESPRAVSYVAMLAPRTVAAYSLALVAGCTPATPAGLPPAKRAMVVPVEPQPRYSIPTCPLRYEMKTLETSHMDGVPAAFEAQMGAGFLTFATVDARPSGRQLELVASVLMQPLMGKHRASMPPDTTYAPVHLETDGTRWVERDGPTQVFDELGTQGGLRWFFPDLPASGAVGASTDWEIPRVVSKDAWKTEAARGSRPGLKEQLERAEAAAAAATPAPTPTPTPNPIAPSHLKVVVERWAEEKGVKVVDLSATGTEHVSDATASSVTGLMVTATFTYRGTYRVTAAGRLLRASIEKDGVVDMRGPDPQSNQHHTQHMARSMNLVAACDGPTEATLRTPLTLEERAIEAWTDIWIAFTKGERDKVLAAFDPALRTKHGDTRIWEALSSYKTLRGEGALPLAVMVRDEDVSSVGGMVRLVVHGNTLDPQSQSLMPLDVMISLRETGDRWAAESLRADLALDERRNLLEISRDRVVVRKGWPPK